MGVKARLLSLAEFGALEPGRSVTRLAWSKPALASAAWLMEEMRDAGLRSWMDDAGNVIGVWEAGLGKAVGVGSHYDTTPSSGIFDGALGLVGAIEAIHLLRSRGFAPKRPIWVIGFNDEEGKLGVPCVGSKAFCGKLALDELDRKGALIAIEDAGFDPQKIANLRWIDQLQSFVELHVEQGPVLDAGGTDIGVVMGAVGARVFRVDFDGQANHAGTTPMGLRRDALCAAARTILAVREYARPLNATGTVGQIEVTPAASNAIPGHASMSIDFRSVDLDALRGFETALDQIVGAIAREENVGFHVARMHTHDPIALDSRICDMVQAIAARRGASHVRLPSGAGHDCLVLAPLVATGLIFVPSQNGISHSPDEFTTEAHCALGVEVMAEVIELLAS